MLFTARGKIILPQSAAKSFHKLLPVLNANVHTGEDGSEVCRCGIVGAGLGGTSAAYYLKELWGDKPLQVDIFEAKGQVGGRLTLVNIDGEDYDAGGDVIHSKNRYMAGFAEKFGLGRRRLRSRSLGLYNNRDGLYFETSPWKGLTLAKMFSRYGRNDMKRLQNWVSETMRSFGRIYEHQNGGLAFTTVENLLQSMDERYPKFARITTHTMFRDAGFSDKFINEVIKGVLIRNCGQSTNVHGFVGCTSTAGVQPKVWAVRGGNRRVPEKLLEASGATLIPGEVTRVFRAVNEDEKEYFEVQYRKTQVKLGEDDTGMKEYDILIIATPLSTDYEEQIQFDDFPGGVRVPEIPFRHCDVLLVHGRPNKDFFGKERVEDIPRLILATDTDVFFNKMGKQTPVTNGRREEYLPGYGVWKLYFNETPTEKQLKLLFDGRKDFQLMQYHAYPEYTPREGLPSFQLHDRIYYPNAVEHASSFMEMAVVGARNVALLAYNQWFGHQDKIDAATKPRAVPSDSVKEKEGKEKGPYVGE